MLFSAAVHLHTCDACGGDESKVFLRSIFDCVICICSYCLSFTLCMLCFSRGCRFSEPIHFLTYFTYLNMNLLYLIKCLECVKSVKNTAIKPSFKCCLFAYLQSAVFDEQCLFID